MGQSPLVFVALTLAIDMVFDALWSGLNAHTSYVGWSFAVIIAYQHLIPLGASASLAGAVAGKGLRGNLMVPGLKGVLSEARKEDSIW